VGYCKLDSEIFCGGAGLFCRFFGVNDGANANFRCSYGLAKKSKAASCSCQI
jgi:hypothetical protein